MKPILNKPAKISSPGGKKSVLALLAGGGTLPQRLATAALAKGWPVHVVSFVGQDQPQDLPAKVASQQIFPLGAVGKILRHLRAQGVTHVALAGHLHKPSVFDLKLDWFGVKAVARLAKESWHDDVLLRAVATVLQEQGFSVLGTADLAPQLLAPQVKAPTALGEVKPTAADLRDVDLAVQALEVVGRLDIGQAVVVHQQTILGVEAVEGTDALLTRCASLRGAKNQGGLLVKLAKPGQTDLADLPTVGPATLAALRKHGYRGLVVQGGGTLLLDEPALVASANQNQMLLMVVPVPWQKKPRR